LYNFTQQVPTSSTNTTSTTPTPTEDNSTTGAKVVNINSDRQLETSKLVNSPTTFMQ